MGGTNVLCVLLLLATSLPIAMAQDEENIGEENLGEANLGADDVARQSDVLTIKAVQSATAVELQTLQFKVDSIVKMLQDLTNAPPGIDHLLSFPDNSLSFSMES